MTSAPPDDREADLRIVYCGASGAGKTTNLEQIHASLDPATRGRLVMADGGPEHGFGFDFLAVDLGTIRGERTRLHLYTLPTEDGGKPARDRLLGGADGVVLVVDSSASRMEENREALQSLRRGLEAAGRTPGEVVPAVQYNKRDLPDALPVEELEAAINPAGAPHFEAVANRGEGVLETLEEVAFHVVRMTTGG